MYNLANISLISAIFNYELSICFIDLPKYISIKSAKYNIDTYPIRFISITFFTNDLNVYNDLLTSSSYVLILNYFVISNTL
jgi:hypothetical protein